MNLMLWCLIGFAACVDESNSQTFYAHAQIVFQEPISQMSERELTDALETLRERTTRLQRELNSTNGYFNEGSDSKVESNTLTGEGSSSRTAPAKAPSSKLSEIKENIKLLKKIFAEKERRALEEVQRLKKTNQKKGWTLPKEGQPMSPNMNQGSDSKTEMTDEEYQDVRIPKRAVEGIVDPFELGNSLFMAGNVEEALKFYDLVSKQNMTPFQKRWLELMLACCYRTQGKYAEAQASLRIVANDRDGVNASKTARSLQKYINSKMKIDAVSEQVNSQADAVMEKANNLLKEFEDAK